jgi:hypothetical protein
MKKSIGRLARDLNFRPCMDSVAASRRRAADRLGSEYVSRTAEYALPILCVATLFGEVRVKRPGWRVLAAVVAGPVAADHRTAGQPLSWTDFKLGFRH